MRKLYWVLIIIAVILVINEFVIFPIFPSSSSSASCPRRTLFSVPDAKPPGLVNDAEIILTGTAGDSRWVTIDPSKGHIETYTNILVENIIKDSYSKDDLTVSQYGGCDIRLNYCVGIAGSISLEKGERYLLFLSESENGVYKFGICGGGHIITKNENGNDIVSCFAMDIENCTNGFVKLDDLVNQIQG